MKTLIFDASPLIYLAKVDLIKDLKELPGKKIIPKKVYKEVIEAGSANGLSDAIRISQAIDQGIFEISEVKNADFYTQLLKTPRLHKADAEVLALAKELKGCAVIDEKAGRNIAEQEKIECGSTVFILFKLLKNKIIDKTEFKKYLDEMIAVGWYCSSEFYISVIGLLDAL